MHQLELIMWVDGCEWRVWLINRPIFANAVSHSQDLLQKAGISVLYAKSVCLV